MAEKSALELRNKVGTAAHKHLCIYGIQDNGDALMDLAAGELTDLKIFNRSEWVSSQPCTDRNIKSGGCIIDSMSITWFWSAIQENRQP